MSWQEVQGVGCRYWILLGTDLVIHLDDTTRRITLTDYRLTMDRIRGRAGGTPVRELTPAEHRWILAHPEEVVMEGIL